MSQVSVEWLNKERFVGIDSTNHSVVISTADAGGGVGVKPTDLLLLALGSCSAVDVVEILHKKRQELTGLEIRVSGEQDSDPPWTFRHFHVHYSVRGRNLSEKAVADTIRLSEEKYCGVAATVRATAPVTHDYEIIEEAAEEEPIMVVA